MAVDKGAIAEGHVLVLPIEHFPNALGLPSGAWAEMERYLSALQSCYASQVVVMFHLSCKAARSGEILLCLCETVVAELAWAPLAAKAQTCRWGCTFPLRPRLGLQAVERSDMPPDTSCADRPLELPQGKEAVAFERFMAFRKSGGNHCHVNVVPAPASAAASAREVGLGPCAGWPV